MNKSLLRFLVDSPAKSGRVKNVESLLRAPTSNLYHSIMQSPSFGLPLRTGLLLQISSAGFVSVRPSAAVDSCRRVRPARGASARRDGVSGARRRDAHRVCVCGRSPGAGPAVHVSRARARRALHAVRGLPVGPGLRMQMHIAGSGRTPQTCTGPFSAPQTTLSWATLQCRRCRSSKPATRTPSL